MKNNEGQQLRWVGRGRSANVFVTEGDSDGRVAHKVFTPDSVGELVFYLLNGAPNPYGWSEQAILTAVARRRVLSQLCRYWFGEKLTLPETHGWGWNEHARAYEIRCEFIEGRHLPLRGPMDLPSDAWFADLTEGIMRPLQVHLEEAGLDGLVWQAGRGNPVAASNFMIRSPRAADGEGHAAPQWVWIDLESGLPAIFSNSLREQLTFYLPRCWRYGRLLFDDTDVIKLRNYIDSRNADIEKSIGASSVNELFASVESLEYHQLRWKSIALLERGISAALVRGSITDGEATYYRENPASWYGNLLVKGAVNGGLSVAKRARQGIEWLKELELGVLLSHFGSFVTSQRYRSELSRRYVGQRIRAWEERGSLGTPLAAVLEDELDKDESSAYISDFGVHLMIKPFMKVLQWWIFPALFFMGAINEVVLAAALVAGGGVGRTVYTLGRMAQAGMAGQRLPWIALGLGTLPVLGNTAYPAELVACSVGSARVLARFILYDVFATMGRAIPVWGGADTLTEHRMNRLPDRLGDWWAGRRGRAPGDAEHASVDREVDSER